MATAPLVVAKTCTLSVDLEEWFSALYLPEEWENYESRLEPTMYFLLKLFYRHKVSVLFYVLGDVAQRQQPLIHELQRKGHRLGSHGYYHRHHEQEGDVSDVLARRYLPECVGYRSPFWDTTPRIGWAGGAGLRLLPYAILKPLVLQQRQLWLHPHDVDLQHPRLRGVPQRRLYGARQGRLHLDRLLTEIRFGAPV